MMYIFPSWKHFFHQLLLRPHVLVSHLQFFVAPPVTQLARRHGRGSIALGPITMNHSWSFRLTEGDFQVWNALCDGGLFLCTRVLSSQWLCLRGRCRRGEPASRGGRCWARQRGSHLSKRKPSRNCCAVTDEPSTCPCTASATSGCENTRQNPPLHGSTVAWSKPVTLSFLFRPAVWHSAHRQKPLRRRWEQLAWRWSPPRWPSTSFPCHVGPQPWRTRDPTGAARRKKDHFHGSAAPGGPNDLHDQRHHWFLQRSSGVQVAVCSWRTFFFSPQLNPIRLCFQPVKSPAFLKRKAKLGSWLGEADSDQLDLWLTYRGVRCFSHSLFK